MRRRSIREDHGNHERWMVSYADFITLMFAFFVVMFASSQADRAKISEAVQQALSEGSVTSKVLEMLGREESAAKAKATPPAATGKTVELAPSLKALTSELKKEIQAGKIQVSLEARGLVISLKEAAFFPSGDDTLSAEGYSIIEKVANNIRRVPNPVRLEGHTDSKPIHNDRFRSNWDLSAARSIAMLQVLNQRFSIDHQRLAAVAYADTMPVDANDTEEGRARNRRVDVTILNEMAARQEAHPAAAARKP